MPRLPWFCVVCALALAACSKSDQPSASPPSPDSTSDAGLTVSDSGRPAVVTDDAGSDDAGSVAEPQECVNVDPGAYTNEDISVNDRGPGISTPTDFVVTRAVSTWQGTCPNPKLVVVLSNGSCPAGKGHELQLSFAAKALTDGTLGEGQNDVLPESQQPAIHARYTRPKPLHPQGEWRNCNGPAGQVVFPGVIDVSTRGSQFKGRFQLDLASCDGTKQANQNVTGWFNVMLHRSLRDVCPTMK